MLPWEPTELTLGWSDPRSVSVMGCESSRSVEVENTITKTPDHKELRSLLTDLQVYNTHHKELKVLLTDLQVCNTYHKILRALLTDLQVCNTDHKELRALLTELQECNTDH